MEEINKNKKEEIIKLVGSILEPLNCKIFGFGNSFNIKHSTKSGDRPWSEWMETYYPILIEIKSSKDSIVISSLHLNNINSAVWTACHDFIYSSSVISEDDRQNILKKLYSSEFIKLLTNEK